MYGIVLMMSVSGGADVPANELLEPPAKLSQTVYRHRRGHGCCGGGGYGGCNGGGYGGCCGGGYGGGYAYGGSGYGGYPTVYSGYANGEMPYGAYSGYYPGANYGSYSPYNRGMPYGYGSDYNQMPYPSGDLNRDRPHDERLNAPRDNRSPGDRDRGTNPERDRGTNPDRDRGTNPDRKPTDQDRSRPEGVNPQTALPRTGDLAPVSLVVRLPAEAKLLIGATETRSTSDTRTFVSPPVPTGKDFHYTLKAEINRDGKIIKAEKEVTVRGGEETVVKLDLSAFTAANK